jgi:hypothetical protein
VSAICFRGTFGKHSRASGKHSRVSDFYFTLFGGLQDRIITNHASREKILDEKCSETLAWRMVVVDCRSPTGAQDADRPQEAEGCKDSPLVALSGQYHSFWWNDRIRAGGFRSGGDRQKQQSGHRPGFDQTKLIADNASEDGRARDRRVELAQQ